jgi:HTH-type transcriptional regulator/antitoxin HigA
MNIRPVKTEADCRAALEEIERLFNAVPGTPESDRLEVLTTLFSPVPNINAPPESLVNRIP